MEIEIKRNFRAPLDRVLAQKVDMHTHIQNIQNIKIFTKSNAKAKSRKCIKIELEFYFTPPKSWSKKKKTQAIGQLKVTRYR